MEDTLRSGVMMDNKTNERKKKKRTHTYSGIFGRSTHVHAAIIYSIFLSSSALFILSLKLKSHGLVSSVIFHLFGLQATVQYSKHTRKISTFQHFWCDFII